MYFGLVSICVCTLQSKCVTSPVCGTFVITNGPQRPGPAGVFFKVPKARSLFRVRDGYCVSVCGPSGPLDRRGVILQVHLLPRTQHSFFLSTHNPPSVPRRRSLPTSKQGSSCTCKQGFLVLLQIWGYPPVSAVSTSEYMCTLLMSCLLPCPGPLHRLGCAPDESLKCD